MSIMYIVSVIILFMMTILVKKSEKEIDVIKTILVSMMLYLCYNTFVCYVFTYTNIPIHLGSLSIVNILVSAFMAWQIKKKGIQKYQFDKKDILVIVGILLLVFVLSAIDFGIPFNIKYLTTDASVHYGVTYRFYQSDTLLLKAKEDKTEMMPGAYSNVGIWFKVLEPFVGEMNFYKIFIAFDMFMLAMSGILLYITIKQYAKHHITYAIAIIVAILYMLGYPFNNMLFGYFYLPLGVLIISTILLVMESFEQEEMKKIPQITALFLLCLELFLTYYLFVPAIYGAIFLFYILHFYCESNKVPGNLTHRLCLCGGSGSYKKHGKIMNKEMIIYTMVTLILPSICGFFYTILPSFQNANSIKATSQIALEGYIYRNLFSNLLLFIPFFVYYFKKQAKINFHMLLTWCLVIYMCILYLGTRKGLVSTYYFYKTYFVMWLVMLYGFYRGMVHTVENTKYGKWITGLYITLYILIMVFMLSHTTVNINKSTDTHEKITDVMDIYGLNKTILLKIGVDYTPQELKILNNVKQNQLPLQDNNTLIIGNQRQEYWFYAMLKYRFKENLDYATTTTHIENWNNGTYEYLIYFKRSDYYNQYKDMLHLENTQVIFENETGAIIKHKQ